jgi:CheY-like chemotaxis protein
MMPGINGIEVCRELKSDPSTKVIRVVAMTGYYSQENVNAILSAGAEACLKKPLDINQLRELIGAPLHEYT